MEEVDRYYQGNITLEEAENYIASGLITAARAYVANGYYLRRIRDDRLYEEAGYKNFEEYVRAKYNKDKGWASKCIKVNQELSADGNSPILISNYQDYSVYQLVEIAYMTEEQRVEADPDMTVQALKEIRNPKPIVEEKVVTSQLEERSAEPEPDPETQQIEESIAISQRDTLPDMDYDLRREYCEAAAVKLIEAKFDWMKADYMNRVLNVDESEKQLKESLVGKGAWYFKDPRGNGIAHVNLFQGYIQFYDEKYWVGDCDWFYLCAAVQSMWNVVALKKAQDEQNNNPESQPQAWNTNPTPCIHRNGFSCTVPEDKKKVPGDGSNCNESCCWECTRHGECKLECNCSASRPEEPDPEPEQSEPDPVIDAEYEEVPESVEEQKPIGDLDLSCMAENILRRAGIDTVEGLSSMSDEELAAVRGMSNRAMEEIQTKLNELESADKADPDESTTDLQVVRQMLEKENKLLSTCLLTVSDQNDIHIRQMKLRVAALAAFASDLDDIENPPPEPERIYTLEEVAKEIMRLEAAFLGAPVEVKQSAPYCKNVMRLDAMRLLYDSMRGE